jgi:hypothetical protein
MPLYKAKKWPPPEGTAALLSGNLFNLFNS